MFGRAYRGGPTKDLALRMKAGQQLVYGEQIGWIDPSVIKEPDNAAFLKQVVQLRWKLRRYFYAGQMARPPRLLKPVPRVTADWQWSGTWPVTTDAVLTGAWALPQEDRAGGPAGQRQRPAGGHRGRPGHRQLRAAGDRTAMGRVAAFGALTERPRNPPAFPAPCGWNHARRSRGK